MLLFQLVDDLDIFLSDSRLLISRLVAFHFKLTNMFLFRKFSDKNKIF